MDLRGKKILVTGASSGIGQATAVACAEKGAEVIIHYRGNAEGAQATLRQVEKKSRGWLVQANLVDAAQIERMFREIAERVGKIDLLVNNAGQAQPGDLFDTKMWRAEMDNIFFSTVQVTQHFLKQGDADALRKIVNMGSIFGNLESGNLDYMAYSAAKAAMHNFTVTLAKRDPKLLVNAVAPGYTWTPGWKGTTPEEKKAYAAKIHTGRFVTSEEIAHTVVYILENDSLTGQVITVDGGLTLSKT